MALADWSRKWFPDTSVFALGALVIVFAISLIMGTGLQDYVRHFGGSFWSLIESTMQMAIIILGGYVVATSRPVHRLIR